MRDLDETDLDIVRLLVEDARRPYSEIAKRVGLSPPAVSDRVDRLREQGIVRGFTLDVDRSTLYGRTPVVIRLEANPGTAERVFEAVTDLEGVEHAFRLFDATILAHGNAPDGDVDAWFREGVDLADVVTYDVTLVADYAWNRGVTASDFAIPCAVCGNEVRSDGLTTRVGGELKAFCCPSCEQRYVEEYENHLEEAG